MQPNLRKRSAFDKKIPTLLGMTILLTALIVGLFLVGEGTDYFLPRASSQGNPKKIKITNLTESAFTISFLTDESQIALINLSSSNKKLDQTANDDRDKITGTISQYKTHYITISGLEPNKEYFYEIVVGDDVYKDENGQPFSIKTLPKPSNNSQGRTVYGSVMNNDGTPAEGALVYLSKEGILELSSQVKSSGSFAIPLSAARSYSGEGMNITDNDEIIIIIQGEKDNLTVTKSTTVKEAQPLEEIWFNNEAQTSILSQEKIAKSEPTFQVLGVNDNKEEINLNTDSDQDIVVNTTTPIIKGNISPNTKVDIVIHSTEEINTSLVSDEAGNFVLDLSQLDQELSPGEHTVAYTYLDPNLQQKVTKEYSFLVSNNLIAQATEEEEPFGTGSPYPIVTPTLEPTLAPTAALVKPTTTPEPEPESEEELPTAGNSTSTILLICLGLLFTSLGGWSYWIAKKID